jgi:hypothetical protein
MRRARPVDPLRWLDEAEDVVGPLREVVNRSGLRRGPGLDLALVAMGLIDLADRGVGSVELQRLCFNLIRVVEEVRSEAPTGYASRRSSCPV